MPFCAHTLKKYCILVPAGPDFQLGQLSSGSITLRADIHFMTSFLNSAVFERDPMGFVINQDFFGKLKLKSRFDYDGSKMPGEEMEKQFFIRLGSSLEHLKSVIMDWS
jgi:hypothetical protein